MKLIEMASLLFLFHRVVEGVDDRQEFLRVKFRKALKSDVPDLGIQLGFHLLQTRLSLCLVPVICLECQTETENYIAFRDEENHSMPSTPAA